MGICEHFITVKVAAPFIQAFTFSLCQKRNQITSIQITAGSRFLATEFLAVLTKM